MNIEKLKTKKKKKTVNLIHLGNLAGVSGIISKLLNKDYPELKIKSKYIARHNQDYYGFNDYYKEDAILIGGARAVWYYILVALYIVIKRPRIIQIHAWLKGVKLVSLLKKFYWKKPIVIYHSHGSDTRFKKFYDSKLSPEELGSELKSTQSGFKRTKYLPRYLNNVDHIIVSTPDLLDSKDLEVTKIKSIQCISNPIDYDLFYPNTSNNNKGTVLYIRNYLPVVYPYDFMDVVTQFAQDRNLKLTVLDRMSEHDTSKPYPTVLTKGDFIPYNEVGDYYRQFEYFLDFKGVCPVLSKAGIEAGFCGCKVFQEDLKQVERGRIGENDGTNGFINFYSNLKHTN
jgi:hypothetical protein